MTYNKIHSTINTKEENKVDKTKDREVKRTAREDKRVWLDQMGDEVEKHAENGTTRTVSNSQKKSQTIGSVKLQQLRTRWVR